MAGVEPARVARRALGIAGFAALERLGLAALCLLTLAPAGPSHARERELVVEVETVATGGPSGEHCEVELSLALGLPGLNAARRGGLLEVTALLLEPARLDVGWDGVGFTFTGRGPCRPLIEEVHALWRRAGALKVPGRFARPAVVPVELTALRRDAALHRALAVALGARETADSDAALLELLVDAVALAPGRLSVRGRLDKGSRGLLPKSSEARAPAARAPPRPVLEQRAALMPLGADGTTRVYAMWQLVGDDRRLGSMLATLLGHPGYRLHERLVSDMGLVHTLEALWLDGPSLFAISASLPGPGHGPALERLFLELQALVRSLRVDPAEEVRAIRGAAALAGLDEVPSPRELSNLIGRLDRESAALILEPGREDLDTQVSRIDQALIRSWVAATLDLRCPAPDETRDRNSLLIEDHGLEPRRYLAISRALGRDAERMRQLDRELIDRCEEDKKLRRMLKAEKIIALHKEVRCGAVGAPDKVEELARKKLIFARYRVDSSAYRPLIGMLRRSPIHRKALAAIDERCPGWP